MIERFGDDAQSLELDHQWVAVDLLQLFGLAFGDAAQGVVKVGGADADALLVRGVEEFKEVLDLSDAFGRAFDADPVVPTGECDIEHAFGFDEVTRVIGIELAE